MNNNICIYQKFIPKYREAFFQDLSNLLIERKNMNLYILIDKPEIELQSEYIYNFKIIKALSLKSLNLIKNSRAIIIEANHKNIISYFYIIFSSIIKTEKIAYCHFIGSTRNIIIPLKSILRRIYLLIFDRIIFYYKYEIDLFKRVIPVKKSKDYLYYAKNSIDTKLIYKLRSKYNLDERKFDFISIGRINKKFNLRLLISSLEASTYKKSLRFVLIGSSKNDDLFIKTKYCIHKIKLIKSTYNEKIIAKFANNSKVFIYPGDIGLSLIHGLAYGLPVLIHSENNKHNPESSIFIKNKSGLLFKRNNFLDLSGKISKILENKDKLNFYSEENIKIIKNNLDIKNMSLNFYKAIFK